MRNKPFIGVGLCLWVFHFPECSLGYLVSNFFLVIPSEASMVPAGYHGMKFFLNKKKHVLVLPHDKGLWS